MNAPQTVSSFRLGDLPFRSLLRDVRAGGIFALNADGMVATWNEGAALMTGYAANEIIGRHFSCLYPTDGRGGCRPDEALRRATADGHFEEQGWRLCKDGKLIWAEFTITASRDATSTVCGFVVVTRDLSGARAAEAVLRESEERFRTMADYAPVLLWMAGLDGLCDFFNEGWLKFTGRTMQHELGTGWAEGVHAEDFQRCMHVYLNAFVARRSFAMEYRLRRADGEYRWVLDQGRPRYAPDGTFLGYIGSCTDITEQREAHAALTKLNALLEERVAERTAQLAAANKELEAFSYSVAHDLRTPLRAIDGFSHALLEDYPEKLDDEGQSHLKIIRESAQQMAELIDTLLMLARVTRAELSRAQVDLSGLARATIARLQTRRPQREIEFVVEDSVVGAGDSRLLGVLMENLFDNAWKFTSQRAAARIEFGCDRANGQPVFFVRDNGAGFDMAYASKLFGVFQRLHAPNEFAGIGIGLATAQRIILRHGGRIWAHGEVDQGATFYFTLDDRGGST